MACGKASGFTKTYTRGTLEVTGWQATCYLEKHRAQRESLCRRTRNLAGGGDSLCLRKFMWWCVHGLEGTGESRHQHVFGTSEIALEELPSMAQLDADPRRFRMV